MKKTKRPRILHIDFSGYGVMTHVLTLMDHFDHDRWEHCVLHAVDPMRPGVSDYQEALKARNISSWSLPVQQNITGEDAQAFFRTWRLIGKIKPDLIHCHSTKAGAVGRVCGRLRGKRVLYTPHSFSFQMAESGTRKHKVLSRIERTLGKMTAHLIAVSATEHQLALDTGIVPQNRLSMIQNSVDCRKMDAALAARPATRDRLGLEPEEPVVCFIARFAPQKMPNIVIEAAAALAKRGNCPPFLLLGNGPLEEECRELAKKLDVDCHLHWLGWRPYEEALRILAASDFMVLPSRYEGLPFVALEAQAVETIPILTCVPGSADAIKDGETGVFVPFGDPEALADEIEALIREPERKRRLAAAGRETVRRDFNAETMARATENVYQQILSC